MNAFVVEVENRPGEMARVLEPLATQEVNILGSGLGLGSKGAIVFVANDEERARSALRGAKIGYREVPVIHVSLEDKPGQALRVSKKLADAGVNIEVFLPVQAAGGKVTAMIGVDKAEPARQALRDQLTTWSYR